MAGEIYSFSKQRTVCTKIQNHVTEVVQKTEDRKQIEYDK